MQTVNLEVAKRLQAHLPDGFKSEKRWERHQAKGVGGTWFWNDWILADNKGELTGRSESIPAPTLCELLELLPKVIIKDKIKYYWDLTNKDIAYIDCDGENLLTAPAEKKGFITHSIMYYNETPATAAAELYIWLCENGYIGGGSDV